MPISIAHYSQKIHRIKFNMYNTAVGKTNTNDSATLDWIHDVWSGRIWRWPYEFMSTYSTRAHTLTRNVYNSIKCRQPLLSSICDRTYHVCVCVSVCWEHSKSLSTRKKRSRYFLRTAQRQFSNVPQPVRRFQSTNMLKIQHIRLLLTISTARIKLCLTKRKRHFVKTLKKKWKLCPSLFPSDSFGLHGENSKPLKKLRLLMRNIPRLAFRTFCQEFSQSFCVLFLETAGNPLWRNRSVVVSKLFNSSTLWFTVLQFVIISVVCYANEKISNVALFGGGRRGEHGAEVCHNDHIHRYSLK